MSTAADAAHLACINKQLARQTSGNLMFRTGKFAVLSVAVRSLSRSPAMIGNRQDGSWFLRAAVPQPGC